MKTIELTEQESDWLIEWLQIQSDEEMFSNFSQAIISQITKKLQDGKLDDSENVERDVGTF